MFTLVSDEEHREGLEQAMKATVAYFRIRNHFDTRHVQIPVFPWSGLWPIGRSCASLCPAAFTGVGACYRPYLELQAGLTSFLLIRGRASALDFYQTRNASKPRTHTYTYMKQLTGAHTHTHTHMCTHTHTHTHTHMCTHRQLQRPCASEETLWQWIHTQEQHPRKARHWVTCQAARKFPQVSFGVAFEWPFYLFRHATLVCLVTFAKTFDNLLT